MLSPRPSAWYAYNYMKQLKYFNCLSDIFHIYSKVLVGEGNINKSLIKVFINCQRGGVSTVVSVFSKQSNSSDFYGNCKSITNQACSQTGTEGGQSSCREGGGEGKDMLQCINCTVTLEFSRRVETFLGGATLLAPGLGYTLKLFCYLE